MTAGLLVEAVRAAGYFAQERSFGNLVGVEAAHVDAEANEPCAPLVKAVQTRAGGWVLTVFGDSAAGAPNPSVLPAVVVDTLHEMGTNLNFPPAVVELYGLVPLDPSELATGAN